MNEAEGIIIDPKDDDQRIFQPNYSNITMEKSPSDKAEDTQTIIDEEAKEVEREIKNTALVEKTESFEELYAVIRQIGAIKGSKETYQPEKLIDLIEKVKENEFFISFITHTYGLKQKVKKLLGIK